MDRDLLRLSQEKFDVAVIGGGVYGACVAWEAASLGLSVALLEKGDFASSTSSNSLKIIHGGFRYLQHADIPRMRESIDERRILMYIAPHLIHPLPVLIPTYGHGMKGKEVLSLALLMNEVISLDRNRLKDPQKKIPVGKALTKKEVISKLPGIPTEGLTGGVIFYDAQVYNSERLVLEYLKAANAAGALIANYTEVNGFITAGNRIEGVLATDRMSGNRFEVRARMVINTSGPWVDRLVDLLPGNSSTGVKRLQVPLSRAINIITRPLFKDHAVGLLGKNNLQDSDSLVNRGNTFFFVVPWRNHSMVGTSYSPYAGDPDLFKINWKDVEILLNGINNAWPTAKLTRDDITFVHNGLLPASQIDLDNGTVQLAKHYQIDDHQREGLLGLVSVVGVKYTTARDVAQKVMKVVFAGWGQKPPASQSSVKRLPGGQIDKFYDYLDTAIKDQPCGLDREQVSCLVYNYGSNFRDVLRYFDRGNDTGSSISNQNALLRAQVIYGIRHEMAQTLADIVLRRTELGTAGHPGKKVLNFVAQEMGKEFGWDQTRIQDEIQEVNEIYNFTG